MEGISVRLIQHRNRVGQRGAGDLSSIWSGKGRCGALCGAVFGKNTRKNAKNPALLGF